MPTRRDEVLDRLRAQPKPMDDGELAAALGLNHAHVNMICRDLAARGIIARRIDPLSGKIVNDVVEQINRTPAMGATLPFSERPQAQISESLNTTVVRFHGADLWMFTYTHDVGLSERQVTMAVEDVLRKHGWRVVARPGREHGVDIDAERGSEHLLVESKGEGKYGAMRGNSFVTALGQLMQRMTDDQTHYGLALPAHRRYLTLIVNLPDWVRTYLRLSFFLVRPEASHLEVGVLSFDSRGDERWLPWSDDEVQG